MKEHSRERSQTQQHLEIKQSFCVQTHLAWSSSFEIDSEHSSGQAEDHSGESSKPFPIDTTEEMDEETCSEEAARLANDKREEIEQALRDGHDDQAWSLVSAAAESCFEWRCSSNKDDNKHRGGRRRCGEPKKKECFLAASIGERSCDSNQTHKEVAEVTKTGGGDSNKNEFEKS